MAKIGSSCMSKIKCFFGYHDWQYNQTKLVDKSTLSASGNRIYLDSSNYPTRFCTRCFKKQLRQRMDMRIYWIDSDLSVNESRHKKLSKLLDIN
jgi:RNase H-fold protein (predicted Holliday junction resolvase)